MDGTDFYLAIANYSDGRLCDWIITATQQQALEFLRKTEAKIIKEQGQKGLELFGESNLKMYIQKAMLLPKEAK